MGFGLELGRWELCLWTHRCVGPVLDLGLYGNLRTLSVS